MSSAYPCGSSVRFQSTPSARRATAQQLPRIRADLISIHALREEGDYRFVLLFLYGIGFQSTPSARRATRVRKTGCKIVMISIHALREEGDPKALDAADKAKISIHALREEGDRPGQR